MEDLKNTQEMTLVTEAYTRYRTLLVAYANKRTRNLADAEDVVQEAFIKIINMGDMVYAATIRNLAFTTVQNLLIDRLRRRVVVSEVHSYIYDIQPEFTEETESGIHANSLLQAEYAWTKTLPEACRKVYCMNRFEELTAEEISKELHISRRTVEAQIQKGRRRMRPYLKAVGGF